MNPIVEHIPADNGEFSHYHCIDADTGEVLWSSDPLETMAGGQKIKDYDGWIPYWPHSKCRPTTTGKYFVQRKDGKVHWETWNGLGFAYNNNEITHFREIKAAQ